MMTREAVNAGVAAALAALEAATTPEAHFGAVIEARRQQVAARSG